MANTKLFRSSKVAYQPELLTRNAAGGIAYKSSPEHALAQYAFTGTLASTYYMDAQAHLETVLELCKAAKPEYVAQVAVASRDGYMKDMPAMLLAYLNATKPSLLPKIFNRVIDNGKMLKNFVQIVRSGVTGRRGFGTSTKELIREWFDSRNDSQLLYDNIGGGNRNNDVSLEHIIRMVHPIPKSTQRAALYSWMRGAKIDKDLLVQDVRYKNRKTGEFVSDQRIYSVEDLPKNVQQWEQYKRDPTTFEEPPKIPFRMLMSVKLDRSGWQAVAKQMSWQELRQNLEALNRHGVFESPEMVDYVCKRLRNENEISKAKVFPYQLLATYIDTGPAPVGLGVTTNFWQYQSSYDKKPSSDETIPKALRYALEDAMETAIQNVPVIPGTTYLCVDVSGSMGYPVTGDKGYGEVKTKVRCVDAAGLMVASLLRRNPMATVLPFNTEILKIDLNPMDRVLVNAMKFAKHGEGGTACSKPLVVLNDSKADGDTVIFVSDNESWSDSKNPKYTAMMEQWKIFKIRNPKAKLVCIDITPKANAQVIDEKDILCIGGFSDQVFHMIRQFVNGNLGHETWVKLIESVKI